MAEILKGKPVADSLSEKITEKVAALREKGVSPALAIVRVGDNPGDIAYEKGAVKRAGALGIEARQCTYPADITEDALIDVIHGLNADDKVHGVLLLRPLPAHIDSARVCEELDPAKDIDGITSGSMAGVFMGTDKGYPPCTAEACMELLDYYGYELKGKRVTIMGRSLVIGKPVAMMIMGRHATISVCHTRTSKEDFARLGQTADVVIAAVGRSRLIKAATLGKDQVIIDVGINVDEDGKLCGDVDFDEAVCNAAAITPVPGGIGSVTTAVLMHHVAEAAEKTL